MQRQMRRFRSESKKNDFTRLLKKFKKKIKRAKIKGERRVKAESACVVEAAVTIFVVFFCFNQNENFLFFSFHYVS